MGETPRIRVCLCRVQLQGRGLFRYFLHRCLWEVFALRFTKSEQCDAVDHDAPEALPPRPWFCFSATSMRVSGQCLLQGSQEKLR